MNSGQRSSAPMPRLAWLAGSAVLLGAGAAVLLSVQAATGNWRAAWLAAGGVVASVVLLVAIAVATRRWLAVTWWEQVDRWWLSNTPATGWVRAGWDSRSSARAIAAGVSHEQVTRWGTTSVEIARFLGDREREDRLRFNQDPLPVVHPGDLHAALMGIGSHRDRGLVAAAAWACQHCPGHLVAGWVRGLRAWPVPDPVIAGWVLVLAQHSQHRPVLDGAGWVRQWTDTHQMGAESSQAWQRALLGDSQTDLTEPEVRAQVTARYPVSDLLAP